MLLILNCSLIDSRHGVEQVKGQGTNTVMTIHNPIEAIRANLPVSAASEILNKNAWAVSEVAGTCLHHHTPIVQRQCGQAAKALR
jgi:hypothetical protein